MDDRPPLPDDPLSAEPPPEVPAPAPLPAGPSARRAALADALGFLLMLGALLDSLRPMLLLLDTHTAGGDTPCHIPTLAFLHDHLLPQGRLHGWYAGAYLGHPLLLYYFPLPFLVMSALVGPFGLAVAFKLGAALGPLMLPPVTYASLRRLRLPFPAPLLGAAAATVFLYCEENPIWGGTLASALTGEIAYAYGTALAVLTLAVAWRAHADGRSPVAPGLLLGLTGVAHGYAVLWAGLSCTFVLFGSRRPLASLAWLTGVATVAFGSSSFFMLPLLADWGWTTPYNDAWITTTLQNLAPPLLWVPMGAGVLGLGGALVARWRWRDPLDGRLFLFAHAAAVAAALAVAGPALGIIDIRFLPFAQLALCVLGGIVAGLALSTFALGDVAALGIVLLGLTWGDSQSKVVRYWIDYNFGGLEAKENWAAFRQVAERLRGTVADPRVAVEYGVVHEKAGSIRMYETLPFFSGRSTLEGVYNQASLSTHPVYYVSSELGESSPNPFKSREFATFDTEAALSHLRMLAAGDIVAISDRLRTSLNQRADVEHVARFPPYDIYRLREAPAYVEPLRFAPVRAGTVDWRDRAYRWWTRTPMSPALLVFTDDPQFTVTEPDPWLAPPAIPLPDDGVVVTSRMEAEAVDITTNRPGHPLLVKVSWHPRWRVEGGDGPFLATPSLMVVVPRQEHVRVVYAGRTAVDYTGYALTAVTLLACLGLVLRWPARAEETGGRRWAGIVPTALLLVLAAGRLRGAGEPITVPVADLADRASQAYAAERWDDAAEYLRHAIPKAEGRKDELLTLRGEALLRGGHAAAASRAFSDVLAGSATSPYRAEALFGRSEARKALADPEGAAVDRHTLRTDFPQTPWAARAAE